MIMQKPKEVVRLLWKESIYLTSNGGVHKERRFASDRVFGDEWMTRAYCLLEGTFCPDASNLPG